MKTIFSAISPILFLLVCCADQQRNVASSERNHTENVIILVIDGPRYSETWGDPEHTYIPNMAQRMAQQGVVFTNFRNDGYTYTNSGHTAITTGFKQPINNTTGSELPQYPSIFQYYLKKTGASPSKTWIITSKDKLAILGNTNDSEWKDQFLPSLDCGLHGQGSGYRNDTSTYLKVLETLNNHHPTMMLVNFKEPDISAHAGNWEGYLNGIRDTDFYVYKIWEYLNSDTFYKGKTALFITNDHGRHLDGIKDGFKNHGDGCEGCRHINLFAFGPEFGKNRIVADTFNQEDLAATVAKMYNLSMPHCQGKSIDKLFVK